MGLFGASWKWEEIQKKDAIMGELRKENDRILKEQRKENNRILKEQRKENDRVQKEKNRNTKYQELDPNALKIKGLARKKERLEYFENIRSLLSANKYFSAYTFLETGCTFR